MTTPKTSRIASGQDLGELTIIISPGAWAYCEYIGTRTQLEAEGVIPAGTEWPDGFFDIRWKASDLDFWLRRQRPEGVKGPRRAFLDCDNWCLRMRKSDWNAFDGDIERKAKDLRRMIYDQSPEGRAAFMTMIDLSLDADDDEKFQAFKALIPGLIPPPRKRRGPKLAFQSQEENHG